MTPRIERFDPEVHSVEVITELLHSSYAVLAGMGLRFWATHQGPEVTLKRLSSGIGLVALDGDEIIGTISYYDDCPDNGCAWYQRPEVGRFGQFAVRPDLQQTGIGRLLIAEVESIALARGKAELALDTSDQAKHLHDYYRRKGFRMVGTMQWQGVNYESIVMSKTLAPA